MIFFEEFGEFVCEVMAHSPSPIDQPFPAPVQLVGNLRNDDRRRRQRERPQSDRFILATQPDFARNNPFLYISSLPSLHDYNVKVLSWTGTQDNDFSWTLIQSFRIQLQNKLPTSDELNEMESNKRYKVWGSAYSLFKWRFHSRRRRCLSSPVFSNAHSTISKENIEGDNKARTR